MPNEFLPERFDPSHQLSLTPGGKKRSAYSFLPFSAGRRICFGKTFAEFNLKFITLYLAVLFDFEFVNQEQKKLHPKTQGFRFKYQPIPIRFSRRKI